METLTVALGSREYPILVGQGILENGGLLLPFLRSPKIAIVTNTTVAPLYLERFSTPLRLSLIHI